MNAIVPTIGGADQNIAAAPVIAEDDNKGKRVEVDAASKGRAVAKTLAKEFFTERKVTSMSFSALRKFFARKMSVRKRYTFSLLR